MIAVHVAGIPVPQGSMRGFVRGGHVSLTSDNPKLRGWRQDVTVALAEARGAVQFTGAVMLGVSFALPRPAGHFGRHGILPSAPVRPIGSHGDLDKLVRAIGDAATAAGVWRDDGQVAVLRAAKRWVNEGEGPGAYVEITELVP